MIGQSAAKSLTERKVQRLSFLGVGLRLILIPKRCAPHVGEDIVLLISKEIGLTLGSELRSSTRSRHSQATPWFRILGHDQQVLSMVYAGRFPPQCLFRHTPPRRKNIFLQTNSDQGSLP